MRRRPDADSDSDADSHSGSYAHTNARADSHSRSYAHTVSESWRELQRDSGVDRDRDLHGRPARDFERRAVRGQMVDSKPESGDQFRRRWPMASNRFLRSHAYSNATGADSDSNAHPDSRATPTPPPVGSRKTIAYFAQWGIYARNFKVKDLDTTGMASKLTHIHYAFGNINEQGRCFVANQLGQGDAWADYQRRFTAAESVDGVADTFNQSLAGNFNQLRKLKQKHPHIKVIFSLGGWTWSKFFSNAALPVNRQAFVASCLDLFIKGNLPVFGGETQGGPGSAFGVFDGIDIDWEWPGSEGNVGNVIRPEDRVNFTAMLAEFRAQLDAYGAQVGRAYTLSAFLPADVSKVDAGFEVNRIFNHLDYATLQGYDLHGAWENSDQPPVADPQPAL